MAIMVEIVSKNGAGNIYIHAYFEKLSHASKITKTYCCMSHGSEVYPTVKFYFK
jgi:hypothetical protein